MRQIEKILSTVGRPFSPLYAFAMGVRAAWYRKHIFKQYRAPVPVVSIGNLTLGGTGKTPAVASVCRFLLQKGSRPAVISRGYKGRSRQAVTIVSEGEKPLLPPDICGDEPRMLAEMLPGVVVLTAKKRMLGARAAVEKYGCSHLVLDDGFQHLGMARDLDIVLFNAGTFLGNCRVFPGGPLREPLTALNRADLLAVTSSDQQAPEAMACLEALSTLAPGKPSTILRYRATACVQQNEAGGRNDSGLETLRGKRVYLFCGIGSPGGFVRLAEQQGVVVAGSTFFRDHHPYSRKDIEEISRKALHAGADLLLTTTKDFVKIPSHYQTRIDLYALACELVLDDTLQQALEGVV